MSKPIEWAKLILDNWKIIAPILILLAGGGFTGYSFYGDSQKLSVSIDNHQHADPSIQRMKDHIEEHH